MLRREISRLLRPDDMKGAIQLIRSDTASEPTVLVPEEFILKMKVDELRAQLLTQGVKTTTKTRKAELVTALSGLLKNAAGEGDKTVSDRPVVTPRTITHAYVPCREGDLDSKLEALLISLTLHRPAAPLVFLPDGAAIDAVVRRLVSNGFEAMPLHAATSSQAAVDAYANALALRSTLAASGPAKNAAPLSPLPLLVASESSARGLHFDGVDAVFILSRPESADEYLHLAGRTGRCGLPGNVISIVTFREAAALKGWSSHLGFSLTKLAGIAD
jgi:superfamily II DNA/RNA helicase